MRCWVASVLLVVLTTAYAVPLQQSISICCDKGVEHAKMEGSCEAIDTKQVPDMVPMEEGDADDCHVMMRSCCVKELQRNMCLEGVYIRANVGSCDRVQGDGCASIGKTCCECCELGIKAFHQSAPCEGTDLGRDCDLAFWDCCRRASGANDIDECTIAKDNNHRLCSAKCVNMISSFVCECPIGYILSSADNMTCVRERVDPNNPCDASFCEQRCQANGNSYVCTCEEGYELQENEYSCRETNPSTSLACMFANCEYACRPVNSSSYLCYCEQGYELDRDGVTCIDINECTELADICHFGREECINTVGSYRCIQRCSTGMSYNMDSGRCEDINECEEENVCPLHKMCQNYRGGFYCQSTRCLTGQQYSIDAASNVQCADVDECVRGIHDCEAGFRCDNSAGSFTCMRLLSCGTGYTVDSQTQLCEDINECQQDVDDCPPEFFCQNTKGSYKCRPCAQGFKADSSEGCALDVDECEDSSEACPPGQTCVNTYGSFSCNPGCPQGFQYNEIFRECEDINECILGLADCRANQNCRNQDGSYKCICHRGMDLNERTRECQDINECERNTHNCRYNQQCFNHVGSFSCQNRCQVNFRYSEEEGCVDINECELSQYPCLGNSQCVNLQGSFRCQQCPRGQIANRDARQCEDVDECKYQGASCMGGCRNTFGSYVCTCPSGYELVSRYNCRDINECRRNIHNCSSQSACFDTRGGFKCKNIQCPQYFRKEINGDEVRCIKVTLCPNNDFNCVNEPVKLITYNKIPPLPSLTRELTQPIQLLRLQIGDLSATQLRNLQFVLTQGNDLGAFSVTKSYSALPNQRWLAMGTLYLDRSITGPYETDLRLEMQLFNDNNQIMSITVAVFSIDISANPY